MTSKQSTVSSETIPLRAGIEHRDDVLRGRSEIDLSRPCCHKNVCQKSDTNAVQCNQCKAETNSHCTVYQQ